MNAKNEVLDNLIGSYNGITTIYGKAATGKTCCCLLAIVEKAKNNKVIFMDTEDGFSLERLKQITDNYKDLLDNVFLFKIKGFKEQQEKIKNLEDFIDKSKANLVIIDTIGKHYRRLRKHKPDLANKMLISQLRILERISKKIPVLITNQVYTDIKNNKIISVGGNIIKNSSDIMIELDNNKRRKATLYKPTKKEIFFEIKDKGMFLI